MQGTDILEQGLDVIFCGLNPPPAAAATGLTFASASNRFWQVLHLSGFTPWRLAPAEQRALLDYGCGITAAVDRPTRRGAEIASHEFRIARTELEARIRCYRPRAIAFLGKRAIASMLGQSEVRWGLQPSPFAEAIAWVLPNPSGLNRNFTLDALVSAYSELHTSFSTPRGRC